MKMQTLITFLVAIVLLLVFGTSSLFAAPLGLPPRPTLEATATLEALPAKLIGGWIELRAQVGEWQDVTVGVQWLDRSGMWHDVESWRGKFDEISNGVGRKVWWVSQYTFGPTSFRWVVYDGMGQVLTQSQPFGLPRENRQSVLVKVRLPAP